MSDGPSCKDCCYYRVISAPDEPTEFRNCRSPLLPHDRVTEELLERTAYDIIGTDLCAYKFKPSWADAAVKEIRATFFPNGHTHE